MIYCELVNNAFINNRKTNGFQTIRYHNVVHSPISAGQIEESAFYK